MTWEGDLCLLCLEEPLRLDRWVRPGKVDRVPVRAGAPVDVAGWGRTSEFGQVSPLLRSVQVGSLIDLFFTFNLNSVPP